MCKKYDFEKFSKDARKRKAYWEEMEKLKKEEGIKKDELLEKIRQKK